MHAVTVVLALGLAGPPVVVAAVAAGTPWWLATAALVSAAAALLRWFRSSPLRILRELRPPLAVALAAVFVLASASTMRLSVFMADAGRADASVFPARPFFCNHSCLSSYTEAARIAPTGANIFDVAQYAEAPRPDEWVPRYIGRFEVDLYQYPPPFLLLPRVAVGSDLPFLTIRAAWFAIQSVLLLAALCMLAWWIGGPRGLLLLLLAPVVWLLPTTRVTLQIGNFQITAFALAVLGMIAIDRGRTAGGALALGFAAVSKIFPGVLALLLVAERRWKDVTWTAAACTALTGLTVWIVGWTPFVDFVRYQLPRIQSGQAFFWIEDPVMAPINMSVYGLVTKFRLLGVPGTGPEAGHLASSIYALLIVPLAVLAGVRLRGLRASGAPASLLRLRQAQVWLGLLSLVSFRSPFVPDAYALVGTVWLLTLLAAEGRPRVVGWSALLLAAVAFSIVLDGGLVPSPVPAWLTLWTIAAQLGAIAINVSVVATPARDATMLVAAWPRPALAHRGMEPVVLAP